MLYSDLNNDKTACKIFDEENKIFKLTGCLDNGFDTLDLEISVTSKSGKRPPECTHGRELVETISLEHPKGKGMKAGKWVIVADSEINGIISKNCMTGSCAMRKYDDKTPIVIHGAHTKEARSKACAIRYLLETGKFTFTPDNYEEFWGKVNQLAPSFVEPGDMLSFKTKTSVLADLAEF